MDDGLVLAETSTRLIQGGCVLDGTIKRPAIIMAPLNQAITSQVITKFLHTENGQINSIHVDPVYKNILYAGGYHYNSTDYNRYALLSRSDDSGHTWTRIDASTFGTVQNRNIYKITCDPVNRKKLYIAANDGFYVRADSGAAWVHTANTQDVKCMIVHPTRTGVIYTGGYEGFRYSMDGGTTWNTLNNNLAVTHIQSMDFDPVANILYVGTQGGSVYRLTTLTGIEKDLPVPKDFALTQNYPNPFNPSTNIMVTIPVSGNYALKVNNTLGQEIGEIFNSYLPAGRHNFSFNGRDLPSGVYLYRLTGERVSITRKMVLMK